MSAGLCTPDRLMLGRIPIDTGSIPGPEQLDTGHGAGRTAGVQQRFRHFCFLFQRAGGRRFQQFLQSSSGGLAGLQGGQEPGADLAEGLLLQHEEPGAIHGHWRSERSAPSAATASASRSVGGEAADCRKHLGAQVLMSSSDTPRRFSSGVMVLLGRVAQRQADRYGPCWYSAGVVGGPQNMPRASPRPTTRSSGASYCPVVFKGHMEAARALTLVQLKPRKSTDRGLLLDVRHGAHVNFPTRRGWLHAAAGHVTGDEPFRCHPDSGTGRPPGRACRKTAPAGPDPDTAVPA